MSLLNEITSILGFKNWLAPQYNRPATDSAVDYFHKLILQPNTRAEIQNRIVPHLADTWARNYFYCTLLSILFEKEGRYALDLWLGFVETTPTVLMESYPGLASMVESDVLEFLAMHSVNEVWNLSQQHIRALKVNSTSTPTLLLNDFKECPLPQHVTDRILKRIKVVMKKRGTEGKEVWGDNDIIVVASPDQDPLNSDVFCIISCKMSLRERVFQSVFWSMHSRLEGVGRHAFLTLDKGSSGASEIGNDGPDARKSRTVIESTFDRVYVFRNAAELGRSYVIKDFDYLRTDLNRWRDDYFGL